MRVRDEEYFFFCVYVPLALICVPSVNRNGRDTRIRISGSVRQVQMCEKKNGALGFSEQKRLSL